MLFCHAPDLLDQLIAADVSHMLGKLLDQLRRLDLLIIDELGYLPMDSRRANLFFQLIAARYTRGALLVTTNLAFDSWGKLFGDDVIASAILDRLLHNSHVFLINGPSYRLSGTDGSTVAMTVGGVRFTGPAPRPACSCGGW